MWGVFFPSVLKIEFKIKQEQNTIVFKNVMEDNEVNSLGRKIIRTLNFVRLGGSRICTPEELPNTDPVRVQMISDLIMTFFRFVLHHRFQQAQLDLSNFAPTS